MLRQRLDEIGRDHPRELDVITARVTTRAAERATVEDELGRLCGGVQDRIEVVRARVALGARRSARGAVRRGRERAARSSFAPAIRMPPTS